MQATHMTASRHMPFLKVLCTCLIAGMFIVKGSKLEKDILLQVAADPEAPPYIIKWVAAKLASGFVHVVH